MDGCRRMMLALCCTGLLALTLTAGCSSFERQWKSAEAATSDSIAGRWEGRWTNPSTGRGGTLRCVILPIDDQRYRVTFEAEQWGMMARQAGWIMTPSQHNSVYHFRSEADDYRYEGQFVGSQLQASYFRTAQDYGRFELSRVD